MGAAAVVPNSADDPTALECAYCSQESNSSSAADAARPCDRAENNSSIAADAARPCDRAENPYALECILCLDAYETGQRVRTLPCDHVFHQHVLLGIHPTTVVSCVWRESCWGFTQERF